MSDPSFDPPLEDALRALPTPPLPVADREAIREALRAVAATRAGGPPGPAPAGGGGPAGLGRPAIAAIALIAGVVLTAAVLRIAERGPRDGLGAGESFGGASGGAVAPIGRAGVPDGPTPVRRTTPAAVRFVGGRASAASPAAARPAAVEVVAVRGSGAPPPAPRTATATVPAVTDIEIPRDRPPPDPPSDPPSDPPARPRRPTVTPGPVLPATPTVSPAPVTGIAGTVRSDGAPLARAAVRAEPADHADGRFVVGATGDDGRYVLRLPPGEWRVVAEGEGRAPRWWPAAERWEDAPPVTVREGEVTGGIDFDLPPLEAQWGGTSTPSPRSPAAVDSDRRCCGA